MEGLYLGCLIGGVLFTLASVLVGDLLGQWLDGMFDFLSVDFMKPVVLAGGVTGFGGAGILLERYSGLGRAAVLVLAICIALILCALVYFAYVAPAERSENSTGYSEKELPGQIGEVSIPIPGEGYGEVMVNGVGGNSLHIAASWERREIAAGVQVVIVDWRDGVVYVSELDEHKGEGFI
ncbi:protease [Paenibacillus yonginensis]|uniref:Protease n=1 Tax=Paenibacillus yonginensis TaxID=1462996 RepID=A0A1B1N1X4_9BACL|nr:protease [Paenibacillus yonginensis]ANS75415.1 protease [Paenibacillus yonginensis]